MRIPILTFGAIASILTINSVIADTTITSKNYVDAADALKQDKIPQAGTNASTPGTTVVTYTSTAGQIGERGLCQDLENDDCDDSHLVTTSALSQMAETIVNEIPTTTTTTRSCAEWSGTPHTDENCVLWNLIDQTVYGERVLTPTPIDYCKAAREWCNNNTECCSGNCIVRDEAVAGFMGTCL